MSKKKKNDEEREAKLVASAAGMIDNIVYIQSSIMQLNGFPAYNIIVSLGLSASKVIANMAEATGEKPEVFLDILNRVVSEHLEKLARRE